MISQADSKRYRKLGIILSLLWIGLVGVYLFHTDSNPLTLNANEFGDFLAGVFGPVGILWLILGFWQQGDELRNSVDALNLQSEELRNSVEQQRALVEVTKQQVEAEIEAIQDERTNRTLANSPKLVLSTAGGTVNEVALNLRNIGANCSNLNVTAVDGEHTESIYNVPTLANGESIDFKFKCTQSEFVHFHFDIHYLNKIGEGGHQRIDASRDSTNHVGFRLVGF